MSVDPTDREKFKAELKKRMHKGTRAQRNAASRKNDELDRQGTLGTILEKSQREQLAARAKVTLVRFNIAQAAYSIECCRRMQLLHAEQAEAWSRPPSEVAKFHAQSADHWQAEADHWQAEIDRYKEENP